MTSENQSRDAASRLAVDVSRLPRLAVGSAVDLSRLAVDRMGGVLARVRKYGQSSDETSRLAADHQGEGVRCL